MFEPKILQALFTGLQPQAAIRAVIAAVARWLIIYMVIEKC